MKQRLLFGWTMIRRRSRHKQALTFVELLVALAIFSCIGLLIVSLTRNAIGLRLRTAKSMPKLYKEYRVRTLLNQLLLGSVPYKNDEEDLKGTEDSLTLYRGAQYGFFRTEISVTDQTLSARSHRVDDPDDKEIDAVIDNNVTEFALRYFDAQKSEWISTWTARADRPKAIEIRFKKYEGEFEQIVSFP